MLSVLDVSILNLDEARLNLILRDNATTSLRDGENEKIQADNNSTDVHS